MQPAGGAVISPVRSCQSNPLLLSTLSIAATAPTRSPLWFDDSIGNSLPSFSRTAAGRGRVGVAAGMGQSVYGISSSISSARVFLLGGRPCLAAPGFGCCGGAAAAAPPSVGGFLMRNALHGLPWIFGLDLHQHHAQADRVRRVFAFTQHHQRIFIRDVQNEGALVLLEKHTGL